MKSSLVLCYDGWFVCMFQENHPKERKKSCKAGVVLQNIIFFNDILRATAPVLTSGMEEKHIISPGVLNFAVIN